MKTKETNPTRPGSPTPCKQALREGSLSSQYLFLELDAKYSSKVVEDALQCIKMHVAEVSGTSHSTSTSSTKEYLF